MAKQILFVGTHDEVAHHAAPLADWIDYQIVEPEKVTDRAKAGDIAIFFSEHFDRFRHAIVQLQTARVATLYMVDGILEWRNAWVNRTDEPACPFTMRPVLCDKVACIGASQFRVLRSWGNGPKVEIVGIPRLDRLKSLNKRRRLDGQPFRLMVATAKCPSYTAADQENLRRCLTDIRDFADRSGDVEVLWRLTADWDQKLGIQNDLSSIDGQELAHQLTTVDAVVTTPSTTVLEAMLVDLPTAIVDYNNCPNYCRSAWRITAANQVESQINELKSPPAEKMLFQRHVLADSLYLETSATERFAELVDKMQKLLIANPGGDFNQPLLSPPKAAAGEFDSAALFADFQEFQIDDVTALQTQLAHARREIDHLNRQLTDLRAELGEAHRIFDEINGHPIAGRVVKARQKMLDIMQKLRGNSTQPETG